MAAKNVLGLVAVGLVGGAVPACFSLVVSRSVDDAYAIERSPPSKATSKEQDRASPYSVAGTAWPIPMVASLLSVLVAIWVHHRKVRQEIDIRIRAERFESKRRSYAKIIEVLWQIIDYTTMLGPELNSYLIRRIYTELLVVGSTQVIRQFNDFMTGYDKAQTLPQKSELIRAFLVAVRRDLYGERLDPDQVRFVQPGTRSLDSFKIYDRHKPALEGCGLSNIQSLAEMDVDDVGTRTSIAIGELRSLREAAVRERQLREEAARWFSA